jgi:hypothetical protein
MKAISRLSFTTILLLSCRITALNGWVPSPPDVCGRVNTELIVPNQLGILTAVGLIDTCLCESQIPTFEQTNIVAILAVTIAGQNVVTNILTQLVKNAAAGGATCNGPLSGLACPAGAGQVSVPYSSTLMVSGRTPPFTFSKTSGALPPPLVLNTSTGEITGVPTTAGSFSASFKVVDSLGSSATTPAAGCPIRIAPNVCALGLGFWKNHPTAWPVAGLTLGGRPYTEAQLLTILRDPVQGDASLILAHQLIAALLSVANGSPSDPIASTLTAAQSELASVGLLPAGVNAGSSLGQAMTDNADILEKFNSDVFPSQGSCTGAK